jgi:nucleoid-associated protein YgaU
MHERLKVFEFLMPANFVLFDHNPEQMKVTRRASGGGRTHATSGGGSTGGGGTSGHTPVLSRGNDPITVNITKARLVGPETKVFCDRLLEWLSPKEDLTSMARALVTGSKSPVLLVQWGPPSVGFTFTAQLTQIDISYVRVSAAGIPTHATVNMTFKEEPSMLSMTNPTSGGRPGRNRHIVTAAESLASIATRYFGSPGAWRAIAEVNDIDDPASIRPGDVVYLPARDELRALAEESR